MTLGELQSRVDAIPPSYIFVLAGALMGYYGSRLDTTLDSMRDSIIALRITSGKQAIILENLTNTQNHILARTSIHGGDSNG